MKISLADLFEQLPIIMESFQDSSLYPKDTIRKILEELISISPTNEIFIDENNVIIMSEWKNGGQLS